MAYIEIVLVLSIGELLLFALFLLGHNKGKRLSHRILGLFLLLQAVGCLDLLLQLNGFLTKYPQYAMIGNFTGLASAPLLYLYTLSLLRENFRLKWKYLIHGTPYLAAALISFFSFHIHDPEIKRQLLLSGWGAYQGVILGLSITANLTILGYFSASLFLLGDYTRGLRHRFSELESHTLSWLRLVLLGLMLCWVFNTAYQLLSGLILDFSTWRHLMYFQFGGFLFLLNILIFKALNQHQVFLDIGIVQKTESIDAAKPTAGQIQSIKNLMAREKPHLQSTLSLVELANQSGLTPMALSRLLNKGLEQNFFDFVNRYRVAEAKQLIKESSHSTTLLNIAFESGFNSKTAFNRAFKKHEGLTPSEFKKASQSTS